MTSSAIQEQIDIIKRATEKALRSKEATLQFLISAGIINPDKVKQTSSKGRKAKK
jgi:hypothetical protein